MNYQKNNKKKLIIGIILFLVLLVIIPLLNRGGGSEEFELTISSPNNGARSVDFDIDAISFNFSQEISPDFNTNSITINPELEVDIKVESGNILLLPRESLRQDTSYTVTTGLVTSENDQTIDNVELTFKTRVDQSFQGGLKRKAAEYYDGFSIMFLEDIDAYLITISDIPVEENEKQAREILARENITDENSKIIVELSRDLINSGSPSDPPLPPPARQLR
jgi:hypothetical protein